MGCREVRVATKQHLPLLHGGSSQWHHCLSMVPPLAALISFRHKQPNGAEGHGPLGKVRSKAAVSKAGSGVSLGYGPSQDHLQGHSST